MTLRRTNFDPTFSAEDMDKANELWGANCGPGALAAVMQMTLDDVRPHMGDFEKKHYTNPTLMFDALKSIGRPFVKIGPILPLHGLVRIQWEGPWMKPAVPKRARYRHTHWIGVARPNNETIIFDVNALGNGSGWSHFRDWNSILVPWIVKECVPRGDGGWHVTHGIEVEPLGAAT